MTERPTWYGGPGVAERARLDMAATLRRTAERLEQASVEEATEFLLRTAGAIMSVELAADMFLPKATGETR